MSKRNNHIENNDPNEPESAAIRRQTAHHSGPEMAEFAHLACIRIRRKDTVRVPEWKQGITVHENCVICRYLCNVISLITSDSLASVNLSKPIGEET